MNRSLFVTLLLRILAVVAVMSALAPGLPGVDWWAAAGAGAVLALLVALWTVHSLAQAIDPLQRSSLAILDTGAGAPADPPRFRDFDLLARSLDAAARQVNHALTAAAESRHELEAVLDSMQDAVVAVDAAGRILWCNQRMQRLMPGSYLGASPGSPVRVGHALVQTIRDPDVLQAVQTALEQRTLSQRRATSLLPGSLFEVNASPMPAGGAVAVLHDITRIEQVERAQRDFVANVSHELRTPLTSITGYVETLLDHERALGEPARSFLTTILKNAQRMNRLTEDLLVMARVDSAEQVLNPAPLSANLLVQDAVQSMSGLVRENEAVLEIGDLTSHQVYADHDAVLQVLGNLIENAIKYGQPSHEKRSRVIVSARHVVDPADAVEFSVRDFGQGIASEHLTRIFERFYRVDKARSRESGGTGLGLAIARHIIEIQGGTIHAESDLNMGSTFFFTLPAAQFPIP